MTSKVRGIPTEVRLGPAQGLPRTGVANADKLVTIPGSLLGARISTLNRSKLSEVDDALCFALGLPDRS